MVIVGRGVVCERTAAVFLFLFSLPYLLRTESFGCVSILALLPVFWIAGQALSNLFATVRASPNVIETLGLQIILQ